MTTEAQKRAAFENARRLLDESPITFIGGREFVCANCGREFVSGWTEEEAEDELVATFPGAPPPDCDVVCDDCYTAINRWMNP